MTLENKMHLRIRIEYQNRTSRRLNKCFNCQHYYDDCKGHAGGCQAFTEYDDAVFRHQYEQITGEKLTK